ncbi:MAG TPA: zinc ribbon domain-containing protein [Gemmatimonadaceae bacterium]|nr:zinc ribbon domain-containing protein [Gemmatimonadaceae bacterium]
MTASCPNCSAPASGHFCANCGVSLDGSARCAGCGTSLTPGAKFCHRCGTPAGATAAPAALASPVGGSSSRSSGAPARGAGSGEKLPWAVAAISLLTVVALVAGQNFRAQRPGSTLDAPSNALPQAGLDDRNVGEEQPPPVTAGDAPFAGAAAAGGPAAGRAPDISSMTPAERASRLFDRVMRYDEQGKRDSLATFAPMAIVAYEMIGQLDADQRYDLGRIGEVSGNYLVAKAQADTILRQRPTHLLGLALAARMSPDPKVARDYERRLLAAAPAELQKPLPEYERHRNDVEAAIEAAKKAGKR